MLTLSVARVTTKIWADSHLRRPALDVVIGRAIVEHRNQPVNWVPHHREVLAVPTSGLQGFPGKKTKYGRGVDDGGWQKRETGKPRHGRGEVRSSTIFPPVAPRVSHNIVPRVSCRAEGSQVTHVLYLDAGHGVGVHLKMSEARSGYYMLVLDKHVSHGATILMAHSRDIANEIEQSQMGL